MKTDTQTQEPLTLSQRFDNVQRTLINEVNHHIKCQKDLSATKAQADKLAEALRDLCNVAGVHDAKNWNKARKTLAEYESEVQP